jgi:hypothetical protein
MSINYGELYGKADFSGGLIPKGDYPAVVEEAEAGRTKDGSKKQWVIAFRITAGTYAARRLTTNITVSPKTKDGRDNGFGIGQMFRQLAALGVPVPDPDDPSRQQVLNGRVPFWIDERTGQPFPDDGTAERLAAQIMTGRPAKIRVTENEWDGGTNNKVTDILPPDPGSPTDWPRREQQAPQPGYGQYVPQQGYGQPAYGQPPPAYGPPYYGPPPQQPAYGPPGGLSQPSYGQPQQPGWDGQPLMPPAGQSPQEHWNMPVGSAQPQPGYQTVTQQAAQQPPPGQPPVPGSPGWAQPPPPDPGQPGLGQFTPEGQGQQAALPDQGPPKPPWEA